MKKLIPILLLVGSTMLTGCGDSQQDYVFTGNNVVPIAPVARNDAYTTVEDTPINIPAASGVTANDTLNAVNGANVTVTYPTTTTQGGTVTLGANSGAFTYTPAVGFVGTDTFSYTLSNGFASSTATVTITVTAAQVTQGFFVDSVNGNDATGSFATGSPFRTIQAAVTAAGAGADIVVRPGNYTGAINLLDGQRLLGSGSTLVNAQGVVRPELTGPVILADANTLDFLRIEGATGNAVDGDGQDGGTITNCEIADTIRVGPETGSGVSVSPGTGRWVITDNIITNSGGAGIIADASGTGTATYIINENEVSGSGFNAIGMVAEGSSEVLAQINGNDLSGEGLLLEIAVGDSAEMGLDLEDNTNENEYSFTVIEGPALLEVEQLTTLTAPKPGGAGNTGTVDITTGEGSQPPVEVPNGTFNFGN